MVAGSVSLLATPALCACCQLLLYINATHWDVICMELLL